jgi:hypothetical protein
MFFVLRAFAMAFPLYFISNILTSFLRHLPRDCEFSIPESPENVHKAVIESGFQQTQFPLETKNPA